ncbi:type II secretion system F family protein [Nordella sp. HKS 07]|uniref:type II secretion system F family protein n=1 Tax=Nordella sp. HKS 07 TaxID=2712222 RepID=UPI0013E16C2C|nr:type II secretion system F family protein [Nordella sp. HKS 07]QIG48837.1 type II secretion system F family protein [Nordella sp. HKS 07]
MGDGLQQMGFLALVALAVGGLLLAILYPYFSGAKQTEKRVKAVTLDAKAPVRQSLRARLMAEDPKDTRRKQLQESLNQLEERERQRRRKLTLRVHLMQAGLETSPRLFHVFSLIVGILIGFGAFVAGMPWYVAVVAGIAGMLGLPRWILKFLVRRRQQIFLNDFADAVDIMVRGLKSGLPVTDAMRIISTETPQPVGPEFLEIVEGQRVGISIDQGIERMYERMPLAEVNFLGIVMNIQSKTGGNLAEALNNLSKVLRDRKKMKAKITAMSQEAKASAAIIGSLPFVIMGALTVLNPAYLNPLWDTTIGNFLVIGSGVWMLIGILIMRKMINFDF